MSSNVLEYNPIPRVLRLLGQWVVTGRDSGGRGGKWNCYHKNPAVNGSVFCYSEQPIKKIKIFSITPESLLFHLLTKKLKILGTRLARI